MIKVNFYIPDSKIYLNNQSLNGVEFFSHTFFTSSERAWIVQTFLHLKKLSSDIVCSDKLLPDAINVVHCDEMLKIPYLVNHFVVSVVADRRVYLGGSLAIVQNYDQIITCKDHCIMHWPQTNLIVTRRTGKESTFRIGFLGLQKNSIDLEKHISNSKYKDKMEVVFRGPGEWHDYSDLDAVVAIRDFVSKNPQKPATKLINAWRAGVVFIGGMDSAYEQIGKPGSNYIKCTTPDELLFELEQLINNPELKKEIIASGSESMTQFTDQNIKQQWLDFFEKKAEPEFERWRSRTLLSRKVLRTNRYMNYLVMRTKRFFLSKIGRY